MELSNDQSRAVREIVAFLHDPKRKQFVLGGPAGSGKTTLISHPEVFDLLMSLGAVFVAPTAKAASVLESKIDWPVSTYHSILYRPQEIEEEDVQSAQDAVAQLAANGLGPGDQWFDRATRRAERLHRIHNSECPVIFHSCEGGDIIPICVADESSMTTNQLEMDLKDKCDKVLFIGDHFQLSGVDPEGERAWRAGKGPHPDFFVRNPPDFTLTEVHRQALESPILQLATAIRTGQAFNGWCDEMRMLPKIDMSEIIDAKGERVADIVITGMNRTREAITRAVRQQLGIDSKYPVAGEPLICRRNSYSQAEDEETNATFTFRDFTNGMPAIALRDAVNSGGDHHALLTVDMLYDDQVRGEVPVHPVMFERLAAPDKKIPIRADASYLRVFDFAYAITCHSAQGSEYDHVVIVDDGFGSWDADTRKRWAYTALTRAKERATFVRLAT